MPVLVDVTPGSPEWLAARRAGVTATDIVTILGLSSHDSVYSLFWRKLGQVPDAPDRDRRALGRHMEPYIMARWGDAHPESSYDLGGPMLWRSTLRPWQMATPDSVLYDAEAKVTVLGKEIAAAAVSGVLECKSWADADRKSWEAGPPPAVRAQILWQMDTLDVPAGYWAVVFLPSGRFDHGVIDHSTQEAHEANWADIELMREAGHEFYRRLRLELPPPDPDNSAATLAALRARFGRAPGKTAEVDPTTYAAWSDARDVVKFWEDQVREYEIALRGQAGEAAELTVNGQLVAKRIVFDSQVKAHTRHADYYRRVKAEDKDNDD
jgi:YqaJ-like viral recombinase domain